MSALDELVHAIWAFYAFGPQLVVCLALAYGAARRTRGSLLNWMSAGFLASIVPLAGVLLMAWLFVRAKQAPSSA